MRQTWQWKPNQTVVHVHRYYRRRQYPALATVGAILGVLVIIAAIVAVL